MEAREISRRACVVQMARDADVQDARARLPLALPRIRALSEMQRRAPQRDGAHLSRRGEKSRGVARDGGLHRARGCESARSTRWPGARRGRSNYAPRLGYLDAVGLRYIRLDRQARARSRAAKRGARASTTALGARHHSARSSVLDEATVGLHPTDVPRLSRAMRELSRAGNTVLVIEHDEHVQRRRERSHPRARSRREARTADACSTTGRHPSLRTTRSPYGKGVGARCRHAQASQSDRLHRGAWGRENNLAKAST